MIGDDFSQNVSRLVEQCYKNNYQAQKELYRIFAPAMFNTSLRIVGDRFLSEDIMQESFIMAFEKIKDCKTPKYFGSWLKKIVINRSIDALRKRKNIFVPLDDKLIIADSTEEVFIEEDEEERNKMLEMIKKAISHLPDGYRIVLSLRLIENYEFANIARELGIAESSVRSQFVRAKQKLLEIIESLKKERR